MGLPIHSAICVTPPDVSVPLVLAEEATATDSIRVRRRPEYALLAQQTELARQQVRHTRSDYMPRLTAFAGGGYSYGGHISAEATSSVGGTTQLCDKPLADRFGATVGVSLSVPVYHFGERRGKRRAARSSLRMAELSRDDQVERMMLQLAQARHTLHEQYDAVEIARSAVEQAEENLRLSRSVFGQGMETLADHLEAQALWQRARADEIDSRAQLLVAITRYRQAAGE